MSVVRRRDEYEDDEGAIDQLINAVAPLAGQYGIRRQDLWNIWYAREDLYDFALAVPNNIASFVQNWLEDFTEQAEHEQAMIEERGANRYDYEANGHTSLSNLPTITEDAPMSDEPTAKRARGNEGAPEEGGEAQASKPHNVWTHFPNKQHAKLEWIATLIYGGSVMPNMPFDNQFSQTATSLLAGAGGAISNATVNGMVGGQALTSGFDFQTPQLFQLRMTSPYNILKNYAGGTSAASQPSWIELFDSKYQYYHVHDTEWSIDMAFGRATISGAILGETLNYAFYIFWRYTSEDEPPVTYTCNTSSIANVSNVGRDATEKITVAAMDHTVGTVPLTPDDYMRMGGWHHKKITYDSTRPCTARLRGRYEYGQCKMDIKTMNPGTDAHGLTTSTAEGWALVGATAVFPENLSIIIVQDNMTYAGSGVKVPTSMRFHTKQMVEFRDLRAPYKFPNPGYAVINTGSSYINTDIQFFNKGAAYS